MQERVLAGAGGILFAVFGGNFLFTKEEKGNFASKAVANGGRW
jgi:hypothetical protein